MVLIKDSTVTNTLSRLLLILLNGAYQVSGTVTDFSLEDATVFGNPLSNFFMGKTFLFDVLKISCQGHDFAFEYLFGEARRFRKQLSGLD